MNKRITSLMLCFVMVFAMLATAVPVLAAESSCVYIFEADKTTAHRGDTITFTVYMQQKGGMYGLEGQISIPSGLTYVANSGKVTDGVKETLEWDAVDWTEESMILNGYGGGSDPYSSTDKLELMTFQCTVNSDAEIKSYSVGFAEDSYLAADELGDPKEVTVVPATVNVTVPHSHVYDQEVATAEHLKTAATCTAAAVYYKSCTCGENGAETFTSGSALGHDYTKKVENNTYLKTAASKCTEYNVYWYACSRCDANAKDDAEATDKYYTSTTAGNHSFTEKIEDAAHYVAGTGTDCQSVKKYYYDCEYCDQIGTTTWDSTTYGEHNYAATWSSDESGHWHECSLCHGKKDEAAHTPGAAATETTPQKCTVCDYIITAALGHTHHMTPVAANPATCTEDGNTAYYVCSGCGKWYEDATGNVEITDHSSVVIDHPGHDWKEATCTDPKTCSRCGATEGTALGHDFADVWSSDESGHWHECSRCDAKADEAAHTPGAAATETTPQKCTECDYIITDALGHTHSMTPVAAKDATCTEDGNKAYYVCSGCGKWYEDATGNVEIVDHNSVVIDHPGHDWKEATCTDPKTCSRCGDTEGTALGHDFADVWSSDESGHWHECSRCDATADEAAHTPGAAATETTPQKCTECDYIITAALGHTHTLTKVEAKAPTCTEDGNKAYYVCSGCGKLYEDATGSAEITTDKTVDKATGHQYEWVIDKEATATENGSKHEECKVCHDKKDAVEIPATDPSTNPDPPVTGDNSMMGLWIALLFVSGVGVVGTTIYSRKKKYSVK